MTNHDPGKDALALPSLHGSKIDLHVCSLADGDHISTERRSWMSQTKHVFWSTNMAENVQIIPIYNSTCGKGPQGVYLHWLIAQVGQ